MYCVMSPFVMLGVVQETVRLPVWFSGETDTSIGAVGTGGREGVREGGRQGGSE